MATPIWIKESLESSGVPFEEMHHPQAYTAQQVAQYEHVSGHRVAKVVAMIANDQPVELILPATRRVCLDRLREILGVESIRLASEPEMERIFTGCEVGATPPLDSWYGVKVLMDSSMNVAGEILFQSGTHEDAMRVAFEDWFRAIHPQVESFTEPTRPTAA